MAQRFKYPGRSKLPAVPALSVQPSVSGYLAMPSLLVKTWGLSLPVATGGIMLFNFGILCDERLYPNLKISSFLHRHHQPFVQIKKKNCL